MTDAEEIDRAIKDATEADTKCFIKDMNGKVTHNFKKTSNKGEGETTRKNLDAETSELELLSNLSSRTKLNKEQSNIT